MLVGICLYAGSSQDPCMCACACAYMEPHNKPHKLQSLYPAGL